MTYFCPSMLVPDDDYFAITDSMSFINRLKDRFPDSEVYPSENDECEYVVCVGRCVILEDEMNNLHLYVDDQLVKTVYNLYLVGPEGLVPGWFENLAFEIGKILAGLEPIGN